MDFKKFYEEQKEYSSYRNDPEKLKEYQIAITWKKENLIRLLHPLNAYSSILEVGCAFGELLHIIASELNATKVYGIDIASANIEKAKQNYPQYHFLEGTIEELIEKKDLTSEKFDLVILSDIVEHIPDDVKFLKQLAPISKKIVLNLPLEKSFSTRKRQYGESDSSGHLRCYDLKMAFELIRKSNLEIVCYNVESYRSYIPFRRYYLSNERKRLKNKPFGKQIILRTILETIFAIGYLFPIVYKKYYGSNLFCLLKPINE